MTAPKRRPTTIREWVLDYCKRHGLEPPPESPPESDDAGHVRQKEPAPVPKPWSDTDKGED